MKKCFDMIRSLRLTKKSEQGSPLPEYRFTIVSLTFFVHVEPMTKYLHSKSLEISQNTRARKLGDGKGLFA